MTDTPRDDASAAPAAAVDAGALEAPEAGAVEADDAVNTEAVNDERGAAAGAAAAAAAPQAAAPAAAAPPAGPSSAVSEDPVAMATSSSDTTGGGHPDTVLAAERLADLQRLQAEYVNYKRRVDRDRGAMQERAVRDVLESVLPVLDDIQAAREHGDLCDGPFAAIADKLETTLGRFGLARYGAVGEAFDPMQHEALMHVQWDQSHRENPDLPQEVGATLVVQVLQPGYRVAEQVLRPARVAVADPE